MKKIGLGKIDPERLRKIILPHLGTKNDAVLIGPEVGFDAGVFQIEDKNNVVVIANDPVLGIPFDFFGFFMFHFSASDVAVFGATPKYVISTILLPENSDEDTLKRISEQLDSECKKYNCFVITGHTGAYNNIEKPIGASTVIGYVNKKNLVLPSNAKSGDYILVTKELGLETFVMLSYFKPTTIESILGSTEVNMLKKQITNLTVVDEALVLSSKKLVNAMHDITEGGLSTALPEMADASNLGFEIYEDRIEISESIKAIINALSLDIYSLSSTGSLLASVSEEKLDEVIKVLKEKGIKFSIIGRFRKNKNERYIIKRNGSIEQFSEFLNDPYSSLMK